MQGSNDQELAWIMLKRWSMVIYVFLGALQVCIVVWSPYGPSFMAKMPFLLKKQGKNSLTEADQPTSNHCGRHSFGARVMKIAHNVADI